MKRPSFFSLASAKVLELTPEIAVIEGLPSCALGSMVELRDPTGRKCSGLVDKVWDGKASVVLLDDVAGFKRQGTACAVTDLEPWCHVGEAALGRTLDWMGQPVDGLHPFTPQKRVSMRARRWHPMTRGACTKQILTGMGAIDGYAPIMAGARIAVLAECGVLAWEGTRLILSGMLERQLQGLDAMIVREGLTDEEIASLRSSFADTGELVALTLFVVETGRPALCGRLAMRRALSLGDHLAFELGHDVLVVIAIPEGAQNDPLALASLMEAAGTRKDRPGSLSILAVTDRTFSPSQDLFDVVLPIIRQDGGAPKIDPDRARSRFAVTA